MKKPQILVAEDDADDRFLLKSAFAELGDDDCLTFVNNGVELIDYLEAIQSSNVQKQEFPDIIIIDLNMPKKNGKEVLAEIKSHQLYRKIPVIVYTTTTNEVEIRKCYELGANTYIVKPASFDILRDVVAAIKTYWLDTASIAMLN